MKLKKNFLFLMMVLMIAGAALAGCGSDTESGNAGNDMENSEESSSSTTESEDEADETDETEASSSDSTLDSALDFSLNETDEQEIIVGKVISKESDSMMFTIYESEEEIEDYASVDMSSYTVTLQQETYTLDGSELIYIVNEGVLEAASADDISEGDMIISYTDENEMPAIVIYPAE